MRSDEVQIRLLTPTGSQDSENKPVRRSRKRRNVIGLSENCASYEHLIAAGWTSIAIERYALLRYGEDIPASTVRSYRRRRHQELGCKSSLGLDKAELEESTLRAMDILGTRAELITLQTERVKSFYIQERLNGSSNPALRHEIQLLNALIEASKTDLQDVGLFPSNGDFISKEVRDHGQANDQSLRDLLGLHDQTEADLAYGVHKVLKELASKRPASTLPKSSSMIPGS